MSQDTISLFEEIFGKVIHAKDGEDGLNKFYENYIDLVVTDINMPNLDGFSMISKMLEIDEKLPIIITSAYNEQEHFIKAIEYNVLGYMLKPFSLETLISRLHIFIKNLQNN